MDLIGLLINVIIYGLALSIIWWAIEQIPFVAPFAWVVRVIFALIAALLLLSLLGLPVIPLRRF